MERTKMTLKDLAVSFHFPKFSTSRDFYKAFAGRFCMLMAYQMINVYQLYIIQNYIGQSVKESAVTVSVVSMIMMVMSLVGSFISGPVSDLIGRRKVPVVVASVLFAVGIAMPWIFKSTMACTVRRHRRPRYAVYSAVDQALLVDVLPNKEEAGKDLGILNMATTLGQMCGPVVMSAIVVNLGYNFAFPTSIALAIIRLLLHHGHQEGQVRQLLVNRGRRPFRRPSPSAGRIVPPPIMPTINAYPNYQRRYQGTS